MFTVILIQCVKKVQQNKGKSIQNFHEILFKKEAFCVNLYTDPTRLYADTEQNIENRQQFSYSVTVLNDKYFPAGFRQSLAKRHYEKSYFHSIASISHGNMFGHLSGTLPVLRSEQFFESIPEENCEL